MKTESSTCWQAYQRSFDILVTAFEASSTVPDMETVTERLLHKERKLKEKELPTSTADPSAEGAMALKHAREHPDVISVASLVRNCRDKKEAEKPQTTRKPERSLQHGRSKSKQKANNVEIRKQQSSSEDEVRFAHQHVFSADGDVNESIGVKWII